MQILDITDYPLLISCLIYLLFYPGRVYLGWFDHGYR